MTTLTELEQTASVLDQASPLPLYRQLAELLRRQIRAGQYAVGERIPSEPVLSQRFGIARPTVRQATDRLVRTGLLERRRGSGTYVREPQARVDMFSRAGTLRSFREGGLAIEARWLSRARSVRVARGPESGPLPNPFAGQRALALSRLSRVAEAPVLLERFWLDPELFAPLAKLRLSGQSLSELVQSDLGLRPAFTEQALDVAIVGEAEAALLSVASGAPMLRVQRQIEFARAGGGIFAELYCRTDRLAFCQTIQGVEHA